MGRVALVALVFTLVPLAGCSGGGSPDDTQATDGFEDYGVEATATKGVLLGVVVDEAIRPVPDAKVSINVGDAGPLEETSDAEGRFAFGDLEPGIYLVEIGHLQYTSVTSSIEVKAGEEDPPVHRFQITRLFDQEPFTELTNYDGFIACAYALGVSSTCVNDYTRIVGERCTPVGGVCTTQCAGGCLRDLELAKAGGNRREYVSAVGGGWQSIIVEATWDATSDLGKELGFTVSYFSRPNAGHIWGSTGGEDPIRLQIDVGVEHETASYAGEEPPMVPVNGTEELFVFFSANSGSVAVNQAFQSYQTIFYYAIPEEGWSFIVDGAPPY